VKGSSGRFSELIHAKHFKEFQIHSEHNGALAIVTVIEVSVDLRTGRKVGVGAGRAGSNSERGLSQHGASRQKCQAVGRKVCSHPEQTPPWPFPCMLQSPSFKSSGEEKARRCQSNRELLLSALPKRAKSEGRVTELG
jgi:hypothetical protein